MNAKRLDYLLFLSVPIVAMLASFAGIGIPLPGIGEMRHTGMMWIGTLLTCILMLIFYRAGRKITFPFLCWLPFFAVTFMSLQWSDMHPTYNVQLAVQMSAFLFIGVVASFAVRDVDDVAAWNWIFVLATLFVGALCCWFKLGPGVDDQQMVQGRYFGLAERPAGMTLMFAATFYLAQIRDKPLSSSLLWLLAFTFCIISGGRMVTALTLFLWFLHPHIGGIGTRVTMIAVALVIGLAAFNTPIIQQRFFDKNSGHAGSGTIQDVVEGKFDGAGRFKAWPLIYRKAWEKPWFGHGVGQSAPYTLKVWSPMDKPHNEYLKVFFDNGMIGVVCFVVAIVGTLWNLSSVMRESREMGIDNWPAVGAFMGMATFTLIAFFDNPLVLGNNFTQPLFALIGAANAVLHNAKMKAEREAPKSVPLRSLGPLSGNHRSPEILPEIEEAENTDSDPPRPARPSLVPLR